MSARSALRSASTTVAILALLTGCAHLTDPNHDALRPPDGLSTKTHAELLDETIAQTNDLVQFLGGEWTYLGSKARAFDPTDRTGWRHLVPCDMHGIAEQYSINLVQDAPAGTEIDPFPPVAKVRARWENLGHTIHQIGPAERSQTHAHSIGIDFAYKAGLEFFASNELLSISVQSECFGSSQQ
ncbi:hypothetical protein ACFRFH_19690 [Leifsonia sp. NPDC056824]|uniref:hypothetical protein n=1 Tax=Leifsonia sp. NPDC056824 TaxID=3345953 RepID=UPI00369F55AE